MAITQSGSTELLVPELLVPEGLRFGSDDEPGYLRLQHRPPGYVDSVTGRRVTDPELIERFESLAVPPAWTAVWIAADPASHIQATGRDQKGRKQYRYHARFREHREEAKFEQLVPFGRALPRLRSCLQRDLGRRGLPRERVVALVVELLDRTLVRVGNEEYARANGSFGLTTLRTKHVRVDGATLRLRFRGKSSVVHDIAFTDPRLARLVRRCQDLPGQLLFQFVDEGGELRPVRSSDVNDYLRGATGMDATAKTFRTWNGTLLAASLLAELPRPSSRAETRRMVSTVLREVSRALNNTPAVCRRSYVHPVVLEGFTAGGLAEAWRAAPARGSRQLSRHERKLLVLLEGGSPPRDAVGSRAAAVPG